MFFCPVEVNVEPVCQFYLEEDSDHVVPPLSGNIDQETTVGFVQERQELRIMCKLLAK